MRLHQIEHMQDEIRNKQVENIDATDVKDVIKQSPYNKEATECNKAIKAFHRSSQQLVLLHHRAVARIGY